MLAAAANAALENTYADELDGLYVPWEPKGFPAPALVLLNRELALELGLDPEQLTAEVLSGTTLPEGLRPIAQAYAGHQFGSLNPQLGDGRAVLLGEVVDPQGRRFDLQLKGSGPTPFSRGGDGRALIDSALREYILSEAMHALGVPTTRALAVVTTGETVRRPDRAASGAVLTRVAASHLRVGTLEFFAVRRDTEKLRRLVDYALQRHFPDRVGAELPALALLEAVAEAQARLVARWMHVGFVHGVMNTDNVTLSGETIDYGPAAFLDAYEPASSFSRIDHYGRYAYGNQPGIGSWNLARMAEALLRLIAESTEGAEGGEITQEAADRANAALERYAETYRSAWLQGTRAKLGLPGEHPDDVALIEGLFDIMRREGADFTSTFRHLSASLRPCGTLWPQRPAFAEWMTRWRTRLGEAALAATADAMDAVNPLYIPRNHLVQEALDASLYGDLGPARALMEVLARPFEARPGLERYAEPRPASCGRYETHCNT